MTRATSGPTIRSKGSDRAGGEMNLFTLAVVLAAGLAGPLLAAPKRARLPVVVGEILMGVALGRTGAGWIDPDEPVLSFVSAGGFALVMLGAGSHVPLRAPALRLALRATLDRVHDLSKARHFGLELRISLIVLFGLAGLAQLVGVSVMLAGFAAGLALGAVGEPRRLARQLFAVTDGFLGPVFFVWLGASLDLRALAEHPVMIALAGALALGTVVVHTAARLLGQPLPLAVLAGAQLGVPVAAVTIGTREHLLAAGEGGALLAAALSSVGVTAGAASGAVRNARDPGG